MAKNKAESELKTEVLLIDETYIKNRIYMVRGQKVKRWFADIHILKESFW